MAVRNQKIIALLLTLCFLLSGCSTMEERRAPAPTLPPIEDSYTAPVGDSAISRTVNVPLYLPSRDGQRLLARTTELSLQRGKDNSRTVVQALLDSRGDDRTTALGGQVNLQLYGRTPVETAGGVCTVNLSSSALELDFNQLYTVALALAATLEATCNVSYVNLLVADQPISLDVAGNLPCGTVASRAGEELPLLWEQIESRRATLGRNTSQAALTATATLYFPLLDGSGLIPETRNLTFPGQTPAQLTSTLLQALSVGAQYTEGVCAMPDINAMLEQAPQISDLAEGGRMVTLFFQQGMMDRLNLLGIDLTYFVASINCTLCTFVPQLSAIRVLEGSTLLTVLSSNELGVMTFENGVQRRRQFAPAIREFARVYMCRGSRLMSVQRSVAHGQALDPRVLMQLLMQGPTQAELANGYSAVLPEGLDQTDVLGISAVGDVLLLNLSPRFERQIRQSDMDEQRLCYSMIVTLCEALGLHQLRFYFNGENVGNLGGAISWQGEFMLNRSLVAD